MMPAGQIHLYETKSPDLLTREHASNQLDLHMTVLRELQKTYWTANMQYELFAKARVATLALPPASSSSGVHHETASPAGTNSAALARESAVPAGYSTMGAPWTSYLDITADFNLASHHGQQVRVDPALDFFSPLPASMQGVETPELSG